MRLALSPPVIIDVTNKTLEAFPNAHVIRDATGAIVALCPVYENLLANGQFSYAPDIQSAINGRAVDDDAPVATIWEALINDGWTPPGRPTSAITNALRKLGVLK